MVFCMRRFYLLKNLDFLKDKIAAYKIPSMIKIHLEELPRVASGKFSKKQLRDDFVAIEQHNS